MLLPVFGKMVKLRSDACRKRAPHTKKLHLKYHGIAKSTRIRYARQLEDFLKILERHGDKMLIDWAELDTCVGERINDMYQEASQRHSGGKWEIKESCEYIIHPVRWRSGKFSFPGPEML